VPVLAPLEPRLYPVPTQRNHRLPGMTVLAGIWQASEQTFVACPKDGLKPCPADANTPMPLLVADKVETLTATVLALKISTNSSVLPPGPFSLNELITKHGLVIEGAIVALQPATCGGVCDFPVNGARAMLAKPIRQGMPNVRIRFLILASSKVAELPSKSASKYLL